MNLASALSKKKLKYIKVRNKDMTLFIHRGYDCIYIELLTILEIGLDHSVLLRLQDFPNRCTGSMQSLLKLQLFFGGLIYFHINIFSSVQLLSRV